MRFSNEEMVKVLKSRNPEKVTQAINHLFWDSLERLEKTDPARFRGVPAALQKTLAGKPWNPAAPNVFDELPLGQQKVQLAASIHDLALVTGAAHQIASQNQQRRSHESDRGASPRTPYGVIMDWGTGEPSHEQGLRLAAMQAAIWNDVDTAHPTEGKSPRKVASLNQWGAALSSPKLDVFSIDHIRSATIQFLETDSIFSNPDNHDAKTVEQEIEDNVVTLKNKIRAIPAIVRERSRAARAIQQTMPELHPGDWIKHRIVDLDTWFAGDRDGNVNVTAETTEYGANRFVEVGREMMIEFLEPLRAIPKIRTLLDRLADPKKQISAKRLGLELGEVLRGLVREEEQDIRQQLEDALIVLNHIGHGDYLSAATMHIRQDASVMADLVAQMLGCTYQSLNDDQKSAALLKLMKDPSALKEQFLALEDFYAAQHLQNPDDDKIKIRLDMVKTFKLLKTRPQAWDLFIIANCGDGLEGSALGRNRHMFESLLLLKLSDADHILNLSPLYESKKQLAEAGELTDNLLEQPVFTEFLAKHNNEMVVQVALSDTTRQHGMGIRWYQEEAQTRINMSVLKYNARQKDKSSWIRVKKFLGGATAVTRGGRDPASWAFSDARKFRARAIQAVDEHGERIYSDEMIAAAVAPTVMQTRQGRDGTSRYYGSVQSAKSHLSEMVAASMNFARFLATKPDKVNDEKLIAEDLADQRAKPLFDRAIAFYEGYFNGVMEKYGEESVPWHAASHNNISSRANARNKESRKSLVKSRAIFQKGALQTQGGYDNAWMGWGVALNSMPLAERRELGRSSRLVRDMTLTILGNDVRVDFDAEFRFQKFARPTIYDHYEYQNLKSTAPEDLADMPQEQIARWKDVHYRETCAVCAETLYGNPAARNLTPAQALRPFGRLSLETADSDRISRIARSLLVDIVHAEDTPVNLQIEKHLSHAVFDSMATPHTWLSPGFGDHEYRLHELLGQMFANGPVDPLIFSRHGLKKNRARGHVWRVGHAL